MAENLERKAAIVTGTSRGIGAAIAAELAREGASVMLVARSAPFASTRGYRARIK